MVCVEECRNSVLWLSLAYHYDFPRMKNFAWYLIKSDRNSVAALRTMQWWKSFVLAPKQRRLTFNTWDFHQRKIVRKIKEAPFLCITSSLLYFHR